MDAVVAVFAKPPAPGRVKTRLAASVGDASAVALARELLADAWDAASACPWARPVLATTDVHAEHGIGSVEAWDQGDGDLGARVERVLRRGLTVAPVVFAVGADTGGLSASALDAARAALAGHAAVLAPAEDGGFWLLGVRDCPAGLLADLPWSTPHTAEAVRRRLAERIGAVAEGPLGYDVDTADDLARLARGTGRAAARARAVLDR